MSIPPGRLVIDSLFAKSRDHRRRIARAPQIELNGRRLEGSWGLWYVDVPAGTYHVRVSQFPGEPPVEISVAVSPGQVTKLYYMAPGMASGYGALSLEPPPRQGVAMAALVVGALVFVAALVLLVVVVL